MSSCDICLESYCDCQQLGRLLCGHAFHRACIQAWLGTSRRCPLCGRRPDQVHVEIFDSGQDEYAYDDDALDSNEDVDHSSDVALDSDAVISKPLQPMQQQLGGLDVALLRRVTRHLELRDWLALYSCCRCWYRDRPLKQLYALATPAMNVYDQLRWVAARNDAAWMHWFLCQQRHRVPNRVFTTAIAEHCHTHPAAARAMIDFDRVIIEKAAARVARLQGLREERQFLAELQRRADYRLPYCRELASRLGYAWEWCLEPQSDVELLQHIEALLK
jgi:hypothetical protein